jgi:hypothetical protein
VPTDEYAGVWTVVLDTAEMGEVPRVELKPGETISVRDRSMVVLSAPRRA